MCFLENTVMAIIFLPQKKKNISHLVYHKEERGERILAPNRSNALYFSSIT